MVASINKRIGARKEDDPSVQIQYKQAVPIPDIPHDSAFTFIGGFSGCCSDLSSSPCFPSRPLEDLSTDPSSVRYDPGRLVLT